MSSDRRKPKSQPGPDAWAEVSDGDLQKLKSRSNVRIGKNPEFKKIQAEIKKAKARGKVIKLAESLKESKERKDENDQKKNWGKDEKVAEYLKRADLQEALNIAAELFALQNRVPLEQSHYSATASADQGRGSGGAEEGRGGPGVGHKAWQRAHGDH
jgi:hypothetical protein